ncbi:MAG: LysM peptidoglycan-binding domain-containing protein [Thermodesulfobacteriota bacterium]|nr:LysM peptidoglycan-binding domain-containing protein [Thermodesulfobacteriota bacterium]
MADSTAENTNDAVAVEQQEPAPEDDYEPGFYYTVKKGDTLWDLSQKFYDSEWVWPAMWGQNKDIRNPHLIYPGQRIRLYQRTDALAHKDIPEPPPEPPPPEPEPEVVEETPMPEETPVVEEAPEPEPEPTFVYFLYPGIEQVGFIQKLDRHGLFRKPKDPHLIGNIFRVEGDKIEMISQGDTVYINPEKDFNFIVGTWYYIYKPLEVVESPSSGQYIGHKYTIAGIAEITDTRDKYVVSKIIKSYRAINVGDGIMPFQKRSPDIALNDPPPDLTGEIVGAEDRDIIFGELDIAFINKGEKDGIKAGQRYAIYFKETDKVDGKKVTLPAVIYGRFVVLLTRENTATVLITNSRKDIKPGAMFAASL